MLKLITQNEVQTAEIARILGDFLNSGDCVAFFATLGMGKSFFCRHIIQSLNPQVTHVPSPTFTLVQTYETPKGEIWHCDLYRLSHQEEIIELGLEEALSTTITLIEWPEKIGDFLPSTAIKIEIKQAAHENGREITIHNAPSGFEKAVQSFLKEA